MTRLIEKYRQNNTMDFERKKTINICRQLMSTQAIKLKMEREYKNIFEIEHANQLLKLKITETQIESNTLMQNDPQLNYSQSR
jgi:hypothetical protein